MDDLERMVRENLEKMAHIPDDEVRTDIDETKRELEAKKELAKGLQAEADAHRGTPQGKMAQFRADGARSMASEMEKFVKFLEALLRVRHEEEE